MLRNPTSVPGAFDEDFTPSIKAIDVLSDGQLEVIDTEDQTVVYTFAPFDPTASSEYVYSTFPYRLELDIRRIVGDGAGGVSAGPDGTTIALSQLIVLH